MTAVHISFSRYRCKDDEVIVEIPRDDSVLFIKRSQREKPRYRHLQTLKCWYWVDDPGSQYGGHTCQNEAVQVDGHHPYDSEYTRCKEHADSPPSWETPLPTEPWDWYEI